MSEIQKQYNDSAFRKDLKKLKLLNKTYETRTVFTLKPYIQLNKRFQGALNNMQKNKYNENFTFVKLNKPEIKPNQNEPYLFFNKNMLAMTDIKMPVYQDLHFHINLGIVQNRQSPAYFISPYLKYYFDEKTLFKLGYYKSRANHVYLSVLRNIYSDLYLSGEYKLGEYIYQVPLSQFTLRLIKMNTNNQVYLNYGDMNSIGFQHNIWKKGNYKFVSNIEYSDLQFESQRKLLESLFLRFQLTKKIPYTNFSLNLQTNNSMVLSSQEINAMYKINNQWKVKAGLQLQSNNVNFIAGFKKNNFEISLPLVSFEFQYNKMLTILGIASLFALVGYKVFRKKSLQQNSQSEQKYQEQIQAKSAKRIGQINLIEFKAQENNQYQINRNGLLIIEGYYGNKEHINELKESKNRANFMHKNKDRVEIIDVTIPLRFFLNKNGLSIQTLSKQNLIGFFNPCRDEKAEKLLLIRYFKNYKICKNQKYFFQNRYSLNEEVQDQIFSDEQEVNLIIQ